MKNINSYDSFVIYEKISFNIVDILDKLANTLKKISTTKKKKQVLKLSKELKNNLIKFRDNLISKENVEYSDLLLKKLKLNIDKKLIDFLNLETFLRGIKFNLMKTDKLQQLIYYFNDYLKTLDDRLLDYYDLKVQDVYDTSDKFKEFKKIKKKDKSVITKEQFEKEKKALQIELLKAMEWVKENNQRVLITCDGRDSSGKGSFIKVVEENSDPKFIDDRNFGIPTEEDRKDWFKRYIDVLPEPGQIILFDRSWYNRAVNDPAMKYCTEEEYRDFMSKVNGFEDKLINDGLILIKFWFMITKEKQEIKFALRKSSPLKYWKFSPNDEKTRDKWHIFSKLRNQMFNKTSTDESPWVIVDSNDKKLGQLNAMRYLLNKIPYPDKNEAILNVYPEIVYEMK